MPICAAVPFREIEKRHHVSTTMAFRHRGHMDLDATSAVASDGDDSEFDLNAILRTAQRALVRAGKTT